MAVEIQVLFNQGSHATGKMGKVREFDLYFSQSRKVLEFHRNRENLEKNRELYRRTRFICSTKSFWLLVTS
jgi:hypothetical protein